MTFNTSYKGYISGYTPPRMIKNIPPWYLRYQPHRYDVWRVLFLCGVVLWYFKYHFLLFYCFRGVCCVEFCFIVWNFMEYCGVYCFILFLLFFCCFVFLLFCFFVFLLFFVFFVFLLFLFLLCFWFVLFCFILLFCYFV